MTFNGEVWGGRGSVNVSFLHLFMAKRPRVFLPLYVPLIVYKVIFNFDPVLILTISLSFIHSLSVSHCCESYYTLIKTKIKFSSYIGKFKVIYEEGLSNT